LKERAVSVEVVAGDVIARDAHGNTAALTTEGKDDEPTLSLDGMSVAFVRRPNGGGRDLYRVPVDDGDAERLVADGPLDPPGGVDMVDLSSPLFSLDGKRVLFTVTNGRLGAVCGVDLATKKVTWLATAVEAELLRKGPYRGQLLIAHRSDSPSGGFVERCEVWDSVKGKLIRAIPCGNEANLTDPGARRALGLDLADPERSPFGLH
jgi:dipeptidyl aminopeptidase/acylaminoacyl peptidase